MLKPEGRTLEKKGKAHILESGRLKELRLAHSPEATSLDPILADIVLVLITLKAAKGSAHRGKEGMNLASLCKLSEMVTECKFCSSEKF